MHADSEENFLYVLDGAKRLTLWHPSHARDVESAELGWHNASKGDATYGGERPARRAPLAIEPGRA